MLVSLLVPPLQLHGGYELSYLPLRVLKGLINEHNTLMESIGDDGSQDLHAIAPYDLSS